MFLVVQRIKQLHLRSVLDIVAERNSSLRKQQRWRRAARGAYFVLMELKEKEGDRWPCGRSVEYFPGFLQRRHRVPSDILVFDMQFRLRCSHCNAALVSHHHFRRADARR